MERPACVLQFIMLIKRQFTCLMAAALVLLVAPPRAHSTGDLDGLLDHRSELTNAYADYPVPPREI